MANFIFVIKNDNGIKEEIFINIDYVRDIRIHQIANTEIMHITTSDGVEGIYPFNRSSPEGAELINYLHKNRLGV